MATATKRDRSMSENQTCYSFTLLLAGFDEITSELEDAVYEAGCSDALLGIHAGNPYLAFDREAESLEEAIKSAIKAVEKIQATGLSIEVISVIPPGADTIDNFNAYLRMRRRLVHTDMTKELLGRIEEVLTAVLEHDPSELNRMLAK